MDRLGIILGASDVGVAVAAILVSLPLLRGKIPPNRWYGARFKKSFESDENWYRINAYSAKQLIRWSIPVLVAGLVALFLPLENHPGLTNVFAFAPLLPCVACLASYRFAKKL